jgi:hypothetical protein
MNNRLYETRKSILEQLMSDPNTHPSCKIIIEEVYKRYLNSESLWEYFYTLVEFAELKVGDYIPKSYREAAYPTIDSYLLYFCVPEINDDGHDCNLMLEIVCDEHYKIREIYCIH